jgi:tRNA threonylcarbamoyladenosine biosynthesis protein TsaE
MILKTAHETWPDEASCQQSAARLAACPELRDAIIELHGELGAGKTTFARNLLRAMGIIGPIKSPTYALMESYEPPFSGKSVLASGPASHFDFYRFDDPQEWEDAGLRDIFATPGLKLIEWPEKALGLLPQPDVSLFLDCVSDPIRHVRWEALSPRGIALLPTST